MLWHSNTELVYTIILVVLEIYYFETTGKDPGFVP